jgi:hypothetical protein
LRARRKRRRYFSSVLRNGRSGRKTILSRSSWIFACRVNGSSFSSTLAFSFVSAESPHVNPGLNDINNTSNSKRNVFWPSQFC